MLHEYTSVATLDCIKFWGKSIIEDVLLVGIESLMVHVVICQNLAVVDPIAILEFSNRASRVIGQTEIARFLEYLSRLCDCCGRRLY